MFLIVVVLVVLASALWYTLFYSASKAEIDIKSSNSKVSQPRYRHHELQ